MTEPLLIRYRYADGRLQAALPLHAVEDTATRKAGWLLAGSQISWWATEDGADPRSLPLPERFRATLGTAQRTWEGNDVLRVVPNLTPYQVVHFYNADGFTGWYVNFESPARWRGRVGDTRDWHLDLFVLPDGTGLWKDEEEAEVAAEAGHVTRQELDMARTAGQDILHDIDRWLGLIGDWRARCPDPRHQPLTLPPAWDSDDR